MLRGLVIVLMALDHARDYLHNVAFAFDPLDPAQTTPLIFATRWITHLCAPTFLLLAGVSASLQLDKGKTKPALTRLLLTRGVWLIALELTIISFGWSFGFPYVVFLQVIWAIGWSMIVLAGLIWLPRAAVFAVGILVVAGHNLLDPATPQQFGAAGVVWMALHEGGPLFVGGKPVALFAYPILPWVGVIALGYGLGQLFAAPPERRDRMLLALGIGMLVLFALLRSLTQFGEPVASTTIGPFGALQSWQDQPTTARTVMAFLNVQKYPPSLLFILATLGAIFTLWPLLPRLKGAPARVLATFGAVPFLFYVVHVYVVHMLAFLANAAAGNSTAGLFNWMANIFLAPQLFAGSGFAIAGVYAGWVAVLVILYPLCARWAALKRTRRDWWLSYL